MNHHSRGQGSVMGGRHDGMGGGNGMSKDEYRRKWREWCEWFFNGEKPTGKPPGEKGSNWNWNSKDPSWHDNFKNYLKHDDENGDDDRESENRIIVAAVVGVIIALIVAAVFIIIVVCCIKKKKNSKPEAKKVQDSKIKTVSHGTTPWHLKEMEAMGKYPFAPVAFTTPVEDVEKGHGYDDPREFMPVFSPPPAYEEQQPVIHVQSVKH